jgi:acetyl esterase/lipase
MTNRNAWLFNVLGLPAYWQQSQRTRQGMDVDQQIVRYGPYRRQYAVVVRGKTSRPEQLAFYFHGGAWTFGRPENFVAAARPWLALGFTVVLPSYRRPPTVGLDRVMQDCRMAVAHFASPAVTDLHLGGISAGAHLAAVLALQADNWQTNGWRVSPQKVLLCAGPLCLTDLWPATVFGRYPHLDPYRLLGQAEAQTAWQLLHGTAVGMVSCHHSHRFHEKLESLGHDARLLTLPGGTHLDSGRWMFDGPGVTVVQDFLR